MLFALASGFLSGITMVIIRVLRREENPFVIYFYFCLFLVTTWLPGVINRFQVPSLRNVPYLLALGVAQFLGQIFMTYGVKYCRVATAGIVGTTEISYTGVWGALFFQEMISWTLACGGGIVLASGIYLTLSEYARAKGPHPLEECRTA